MRTRRSHRNQDILFRDLFKPATAAVVRSPPITRADFEERTRYWGRADKTQEMKRIEKDELRAEVLAKLAAI